MPAPQPDPGLQRHSAVRVTGVLTHDAELAVTTGPEPHQLLTLHLQPERGLPYVARIDLGTDPAEHMVTQGELPLLRRGVLASVAGRALELRQDHGHAALAVIGAHALVYVPSSTASSAAAAPAAPTP